MTQKSGRITAKTQADARRKANREEPGWRVIEIKELHTVYHVTMRKIEKTKSGRRKK